MNRTYIATLACSILLSVGAITPLAAMNNFNTDDRAEKTHSAFIDKLRGILASDTIIDDMKSIFRCSKKVTQTATKRLNKLLSEESFNDIHSGEFQRLVPLITQTFNREELLGGLGFLCDIFKINESRVDSIADSIEKIPTIGKFVMEVATPYLFLAKFFLLSREDEEVLDVGNILSENIDLYALFRIIAREHFGLHNVDGINKAQPLDLIKAIIQKNLPQFMDRLNSKIQGLPNESYLRLCTLYSTTLATEMYFNKDRMLPLLQELTQQIGTLELEEGNLSETSSVLASFIVDGDEDSIPQTVDDLLEANPEIQKTVRSVALTYAKQQHDHASQIVDAVSHPIEIKYRQHKTMLTFFAGIFMILLLQQMQHSLL